MKRKNTFYTSPLEDPQPPHTTYYSHVSKKIVAVHCSTPTDKSFSFNSHLHNELEIIFIISGKGFYTIEDRKYVLMPDLLIITPPFQYHSIEINPGEDYNRIMLTFPVSFLGNEFYKLFDKRIKVLDCSKLPLIKDIFKKLNYYQKKISKDFFDTISINLLQELFLIISLEMRGENKNFERFETSSPIISQALELINTNLFTIKSIKEICDKLFITEAYFFRLFKSEMKISPKKYITNKRLIYAQNLIFLGEKPTSVCYKCGFESYTAFYKRYVDYFGSAPSQKIT